MTIFGKMNKVTKHLRETLLAAAFMSAASVVCAQSEFMTVVALDGTGDYTSIQDAVDACTTDGTRNFIFLRNGTHDGNIQVPKGVILSLIGETRDGAIITHDVSHSTESDKSLTSTLYIEAYDMYCENFTTQHTAGRSGGQAECITNSGDRLTLKNVAMKGNQDAVRFDNASRTYMTDCYIEGTVDYIYDSGIAFIDNCEIKQLYPGYIIAPGDSYVGLSRSQVKELCGQNKLWYLGITIRDSRLVRDADNVEDGASYLGRPWGDTTSAGMYIRCYMDDHINEEGFDDMSDTKTYIGEYQSMDLDGNLVDISNRISWEFTEDPDHNSQYIDSLVVNNIYDMDFVFTKAGEDGARAGGSFDPIPLVTSPDAPTMTGNDNGAFTWEAVDSVAGYLIYKDGEYLANTSATEYTVDGYDASATYTIRSVSATGCLSDEVDMITTGIATVRAQDVNLMITQSGIFWSGTQTATLFALNGSTAAQKTGTYMNWSNMPAGCYILRLVDSKGNCVNKKVIKK